MKPFKDVYLSNFKLSRQS